ncbi:MAG: hypothetical protein JSS94_06025 [Bacteroidetes bacterium]|nr:hypothetical protein [Bacteroidota bacterium]
MSYILSAIIILFLFFMTLIYFKFQQEICKNKRHLLDIEHKIEYQKEINSKLSNTDSSLSVKRSDLDDAQKETLEIHREIFGKLK